MMRQRLFTLCLSLAGLLATSAQPRYDMGKLQREALNRGVVALRNGSQVVVSWRVLTSDAVGQPFDVYRNGTKLNTQPLTRGGSFFIDEQPLQGDAVYEVRGGGKDGTFTLRADAPQGYIPIDIQKPDDGTTPDGRRYTYSANDCSVGDVDGDGQYEIILKWDPSNAHDNAHDGFTGNVLFDCYKIDFGQSANSQSDSGSQIDNSKSVNSKLLWRIDMGRNIRAGAHYTQFMVYDFDGDGKAEMICKTATGSKDGLGNYVNQAATDGFSQFWRNCISDVTGSLCNRHLLLVFEESI